MLSLKQVEVPRWPFGKVALFATAEKALRHLCDHLLTRPEAHYWSRLIPGYADWVEAGDDDALYRFARALWSARPPVEAAQELYEGYGALIVQAMSEALTLGWYWAEQEKEGPSYRGLGTSGVYVIWRPEAVRTAMLLGYAAPPGETAHPRTHDPLPRQHAWNYRGAHLRHEATLYPPVKGAGDEAVYHLFKRSARRVRREYKNASEAGKVSDGGGRLGSLHEGVPDFEEWQKLRARWSGPEDAYRYN